MSPIQYPQCFAALRGSLDVASPRARRWAFISSSTAGWVVGVPLATFLMASVLGLGADAPLLITLMLTLLCGFIAPLFVERGGFRRWGSDGLRLLTPALGCWLAVILLGTPKWAASVLWFAGLLAGWYGATYFLAATGLGASTRIAVVGCLNAAACSTPFWSSGLVESADGATRETIMQWLVSADPLMTAASGLFDSSPVYYSLMYMQRLSWMPDYAGQFYYGSVWSTVALGFGALIASGILSCLPGAKSAQFHP